MTHADKPNTDTIVVNGRKHQWATQHITFEQVVELAFPDPPTGTDIQYEVTYYRRGHKGDEGTLEAGKHVTVKDDMIFNVTATDLS